MGHTLRTMQLIEPCIRCGRFAAMQSDNENVLICMHCGHNEDKARSALAIWPCMGCTKYAVIKNEITRDVSCMNCERVAWQEE